ncbi:hypothetical protein G3N55_06230, partial [Dissulfurirhabdus thermomarina]
PRPRLIDRLPLPNGLTLEVVDESRVAAGDRWFVRVRFRAEIPVTPEIFERAAVPGVTYADYTAHRGGAVVYEALKERTFLDAGEKDAAVAEIVARFKAHSLAYVAHPDFPVGVVRNDIRDFEERRRWGRS